MTFNRFSRRAVITALMLSVAMPNLASARELTYQANNYSVYFEETTHCSVDIKLDSGALIRLNDDNTGEASWQDFIYILPGFPRIAKGHTFMFTLEFDNGIAPIPLVGMSYEQDSDTGFQAVSDPSLFAKLAKAGQVTIRLNDPKRTVVETLPLTGSAAAMKNLEACTNPRFTPTVAPTPPGSPSPVQPNQSAPMTTLGQFSIRCDTRTGVSTYHAGNTLLGKGAECGDGLDLVVAKSRTFASKRQIILVKADSGGMANTGSIVLIAPGMKPKIVPVDYLTEFGDLKSDTQVTTVNQGVVNDDALCTGVLSYTLNWTTGTATEKVISQEGSCD